MATSRFPASTYPSDITVALALSVTKTKPKDLNVKDYVLSLRQYIIRHKCQSRVQHQHLIMDRSNYWRNKFVQIAHQLEQAEEWNQKLRSEAGALETHSRGRPEQTTSRKRNQAPSEVAYGPQSSKRTRLDTSCLMIGARDLDGQDISMSVEGRNNAELFVPIEALMADVFQIQSAVRGRAKGEPETLAAWLVEASMSLSRVVCCLLDASFKMKSTDSSVNSSGVTDLDTHLTASHRAVAIILAQCSKSGCSSQHKDYSGSVIFAIVQAFRTIMDHLLKGIEHEIQHHREMSPRDAQACRSTRSKKKAAAQTPHLRQDHNKSIHHRVVSWLGAMIGSLDSRNDMHRQVYEGVAHCFLSRLGDRIFTAVFGHERNSAIESEIRLNRPVTARSHGQRSKGRMLNARTKAEAPYLIALLKHIVLVAPKFLDSGSIRSEIQVHPSGLASNVSAKDTLSGLSLDRVQTTLVDGIFGTEGRGTGSVSSSGLKMAEVHGTELSMPSTTDSDANEWFKAEAWRLLGWEILAKKGN